MKCMAGSAVVAGFVPLLLSRWVLKLPRSKRCGAGWCFLSRSAPQTSASLGTLRARKRGNTADEFFAQQRDPFRQTLLERPTKEARVSVVACGINDPLNIGSILRLMACFGASGDLNVIYYGQSNKPAEEQRNSTHTQGFFEQPAIARQIAKTAAGAAKSAAQVSPMSLQHFLDKDKLSPVPLVILETSEGASSIENYRFPSRCQIVVGSESRGVHIDLLSSLREHRGDAVLFIPMPGPFRSLNAAMALTCALYEYRRQWPQ